MWLYRFVSVSKVLSPKRLSERGVVDVGRSLQLLEHHHASSQSGELFEMD